MIQPTLERLTQSMAMKIRPMPFIVGSALIMLPAPSSAHEFGVGQGAYEDFLSGNRAVLADVPVLLGMLSAGFFAGIWKPDGFPNLWPFYIIGLILGAFVGFSGAIPPTAPAFAATIGIGLMGAAAFPFPVGIMRGVFALMGIVLANAVLSGHSISEIPLFAYVGVFFALNIGTAVAAGLVSLSQDKLPYGWVKIGWRAGMSWIVAISIMAMVLMLNSAA